MARRFQRRGRAPQTEHSNEAAVPAGAVLIGRSMAADGHPRDEIQDFLSANFRRIDVPATLDRVFEPAPLPS